MPNAIANPVNRRPTPTRRRTIPKSRENVSLRFSGLNMDREGPSDGPRITVPTLLSRVGTASGGPYDRFPSSRRTRRHPLVEDVHGLRQNPPPAQVRGLRLRVPVADVALFVLEVPHPDDE